MRFCVDPCFSLKTLSGDYNPNAYTCEKQLQKALFRLLCLHGSICLKKLHLAYPQWPKLSRHLHGSRCWKSTKAFCTRRSREFQAAGKHCRFRKEVLKKLIRVNNLSRSENLSWFFSIGWYLHIYSYSW